MLKWRSIIPRKVRVSMRKKNVQSLYVYFTPCRYFPKIQIYVKYLPSIIIQSGAFMYPESKYTSVLQTRLCPEKCQNNEIRTLNFHITPTRICRVFAKKEVSALKQNIVIALLNIRQPNKVKSDKDDDNTTESLDSHNPHVGIIIGLPIMKNQ